MANITLAGTTYNDIDALLFDKDGTLLDFGKLWVGWFDRLIDESNRRLPISATLDATALYPHVGILDDRSWDPTGPLTIGSLDDIATIVALQLYRRHGVAWNDATRCVGDALLQLDHGHDWQHCVTPVAGLVDFARGAADVGIKLAVVTSDDARNAHRHLALLGIEDIFTVVLGHDQVARGKPYPDMALEACQRLAVEPQRTLLFGDSNGDMQMGREAGLLATIGVCAAAHLDATHLVCADQVIRDYHALQVHRQGHS